MEEIIENNNIEIKEEEKEEDEDILNLDLFLDLNEEEEEENILSNISIEYINKDLYSSRVLLIKNFLTIFECNKLINIIENNNENNNEDNNNNTRMKQAHSNLSYRNNLRLVGKIEKLSNILYKRLEYVLNQVNEDIIECTNENNHQFISKGFGMNGKWKLNSLNSHFRLCKYNQFGHFGPHYDGDYIIDPLYSRSLKTFMVYLNSNYEGGETNFVLPHDMHYDENKQIYCTPEEYIHTRIKADPGDLLLFDHHILHEGNQVLSGMKYIIRSDVMYIKEQNDNISESDKIKENAIRLYYQGIKLEENGDVDGGISYYRRAFKMCPELEECLG